MKEPAFKMMLKQIHTVIRKRSRCGVDCPGQQGAYGNIIKLIRCVDILITSGMLQPRRSRLPWLPRHFKKNPDRLVEIMQTMAMGSQTESEIERSERKWLEKAVFLSLLHL